MDAGNRSVHGLLQSATPQKKPNRRSRCTSPRCPCENFQSDHEVTSAIDNDARTAALLDWLSGSQSHRGSSPLHHDATAHANNPCTNRLHASIVILNAIRDACRSHLESSPSAPSPHPVATGGNKPIHNSSNDADPLKPQAAYDDSFPALSSAASTVTPTILFGRRKKGPHTDNGGGGACESHSSNSQLNLHAISSKVPQTSTNRHQASGTNHSRLVKKKIKPVTVSISSANTTSTTTSAWGNAPDRPTLNANLHGKEFVPSSRVSSVISSVDSKDSDSKEKMQRDPHEKPTSSTANSEFIKEKNLNAATTNTHEFQVDTKTADEQLIRLVDIYATILRNQLAPFLLLELHLLLRLLCMSDSNVGPIQPIDRDKSTRPFAMAFQSVTSCRNFASRTMSAIEPIILNLGHDALKMLDSLHHILQRECPSLASKLKDTLKGGKSTLLFECGEKALGTTANTPHLTIPFDHSRDSRHNYRSADRNRLFQEREELRDAFLSQLRAFQDVRGRLLEEEVSSKILRGIEAESRKMVQCLSAGNVGWFVNFFCDLLLQIGLVPIGETDSDVLRQVADQKRLQQLHNRFTSRGGQTNKRKSSRKLTVDQKRSSSGYVKSLPQQSFRGHQEFFHLFLNVSDSYKFNTHLKRRLAQLVTEMTAVNDTKGLCQHIEKTRMLAKFLGLLVLSPYWSITNLDSSTDPTETGSVSSIELPPVDIKGHIESAWKEYRLVIVIPWVVEFLKMMTWDVASKKYQYYTDVIALLWSVNRHCFLASTEEHSYLQTNMLLVSLQLASFFNNVVGIVPAWNLPSVTLPPRANLGSKSTGTTENNHFSVVNSISLDLLPLWFGKSSLISSTQYFEDLFELVEDFHSANKNSSKSGASLARKVTPYSISSGPLKDVSESNSWQISSPIRSLNSPLVSSPWLSSKSSTAAQPESKTAIQEKLSDCFFHQHNDLKHLCEMTIDRVMKNFAESILQNCISQIFRDRATSYEDYFNRPPFMELNEYIELLQSLDVDANFKAREEMNAEFGRVIRGAVELLSPPNTNPMVLDVASSLAIQHASRKADQAIRSFIREEKRKLVDDFLRKERKVKAGVPLKSVSYHPRTDVGKSSSSSDFICLVELSTLLSSVGHTNVDGCVLLRDLKETGERVTNHLCRYYIGNEPPPCVKDFELQLVHLLKSNSCSEQSSALMLRAAFESVDVLCLLGKMGYLSLTLSGELECIIGDTTKLERLIKQGATLCGETNSVAIHDVKSVGTFLFKLVEGSVVKHSVLEDTLVKFMTNGGDQSSSERVVQVLLNEFAVNSGFDHWRDEGFVIMARLQKIMQSK